MSLVMFTQADRINLNVKLAGESVNLTVHEAVSRLLPKSEVVANSGLSVMTRKPERGVKLSVKPGCS